MDVKLILVYATEDNVALLRWMNLVQEKKLNMAAYIRYAITCYVHGESCFLGKVNISKGVPQKTKQTTFRVSERSKELYQYISLIQDQGVSLSTLVKSILEESIEVTEGEEEILSYRQMNLISNPTFSKKEQVETQAPQPNKQFSSVKPVHQKEKEEPKIEESSIQNEIQNNTSIEFELSDGFSKFIGQAKRLDE